METLLTFIYDFIFIITWSAIASGLGLVGMLFVEAISNYKFKKLEKNGNE